MSLIWPESSERFSNSYDKLIFKPYSYRVWISGYSYEGNVRGTLAEPPESWGAFNPQSIVLPWHCFVLCLPIINVKMAEIRAWNHTFDKGLARFSQNVLAAFFISVSLIPNLHLTCLPVSFLLLATTVLVASWWIACSSRPRRLAFSNLQ